jgi:hypothetical protein
MFLSMSLSVSIYVPMFMSMPVSVSIFMYDFAMLIKIKNFQDINMDIHMVRDM